MFTSLKNHPFAVEAHFDSSLVLTFAVKKEELEHMIPPCLQLDTFDDTWAFVAIAMVQTHGLRPKGWPRFMGNDFFLIGYRVFVRYINKKGKRLRGLYILKSETNKKKMELMGNTFTHYNYTTTDIHQQDVGGLTEINSVRSDFSLAVDSSKEDVALPSESPFTDWKQARRFAGPLPFTFTYNDTSKEVLIIEGVRQNWKPRPVQVVNHHFTFLNSLNLTSAVLANAFIIEDIPYYWKKGEIESWQS